MTTTIVDGLRAHLVTHHGDGTPLRREERVIEETPIALLYNGRSFAVMMATPCDLADFALGFALCEGIVGSPAEFELVDIVRAENGIALHAAIPQSRFEALDSRQRTLEGRSGCGLCGISHLEAALRPHPVAADGPHVPASRIREGLDLLARHQPLNARSGGVHAAGFVHGDGKTMEILVREDVGRHNALDKLVGAMRRCEPAIDPHGGFLTITSRASYEIVHKAACVGISIVVAISAPTSLAIRCARDADLTLIGFARDGRMNVYHGDDRIR